MPRKKTKKKKLTYQELYEKFVGLGKVQPLRVEKQKSGDGWNLVYKEGRRNFTIDCPTRAFLDKLLVEFGGRNPDTCRASDRFKDLNGWNSKTIRDLGHIILKIALRGELSSRDIDMPVKLEGKCGLRPVVGRKGKPRDEVNVLFRDTTSCRFTIDFKAMAEFDRLLNFINSHDTLCELGWKVDVIVTHNISTQDTCRWERKRVGDGSKTMALELMHINGRSFEKCVRGDVFNAAGDMFEVACQRLKLTKKKDPTKDVCGFAVDDGKIDVTDYDIGD